MAYISYSAWECRTRDRGSVKAIFPQIVASVPAFGTGRKNVTRTQMWLPECASRTVLIAIIVVVVVVIETGSKLALKTKLLVQNTLV